MTAITEGGTQRQLTPTPLYATAFNIRRAGETSAQTLLAASDIAWRWATRSQSDWSDGRHESSGRDVTTATVEAGGVSLRRLVLAHPDSDLPDVGWRVTLDLLASERGLEFMCLVGRRAPESTRTTGREVTIPRAVRAIAELGGSSGRLAVLEQPVSVGGAAGVEDFIEGVLLDPSRVLPVVLFSPTAEGEYIPSKSAIDSLAHGTLGVARVFYLENPADTFLLSDNVGRALSAWNGAIRIYWPGFQLSSSPYDHHLLTRSRIGPWVIEWLRRDLIARSVQRFSRPPQVAQLMARYRTERERQELLRRVEAAETQAAMVELYELEIGELRAERDEMQTALEARDQELLTLSSERDQLRDEIRQLKYRIRTGEATSPDPDEATPELPIPDTIEEAVLQAEEAFADTLCFTKSAMDSASKMNPADNSAGRLWRLFQAMDEVCRRWRTDSLGMTFPMAFKDLGLQLKDITTVTKGRYPQAYFFNWMGERVSVGPHLEISRGERIYWYEDEENRQFVINHIGQHLPDSTT